MITIRTADLVGILADTIPFASADKELPNLNCVRVEWDGSQVHALTTDGYRIGWSSWHPHDEPETDAQDDLFSDWGGADDPWVAVLSLEDAKELVSIFKLPPKEGHAPLTVDLVGGQLKVVRSRETGHSAVTGQFRAGLDETPDVRKLLADADRTQETRSIAFNAKWLADFAKVRPKGPLSMRFAEKLVHISIGERFVGAIAPAKES